LGIIVLGCVLDLIAKQTLKDGVAADRWPDSLLAGPRKLIEPPIFYILSGVFGGAFLACIAYSAFSHHSIGHTNGAFWAFWYPAMSLIHLQIALRPKPPSSSDFSLSPGGPSEPLRSEHWGNPSQPFVG
jgi:hypothetical protein